MCSFDRCSQRKQENVSQIKGQKCKKIPKLFNDLFLVAKKVMLIGKFYSRRRDKVNLKRKFPRHEDTNDQKPLNYFFRPLMEKAKNKRFLKRRRKKTNYKQTTQ